MRKLFLDTNFLIALELESDQHHNHAIELWNEVTKTSFHFVTTSYIFDEMLTFLNSRDHHQKAVEAGENLLLSPHVTFVHVDESLFFDGWKMFQQYADKRFSLTDCISFIVMSKNEIHTALSFDKHFVQAGFKTIPTINP